MVRLPDEGPEGMRGTWALKRCSGTAIARPGGAKDICRGPWGATGPGAGCSAGFRLTKASKAGLSTLACNTPLSLQIDSTCKRTSKIP